MPTVTLQNLPDHIYQCLQRRAKEHHRPVDDEIIACLEASTSRERPDPEAALARIDALRERIKVETALTDGLLRQATEEGRP